MSLECISLAVEIRVTSPDSQAILGVEHLPPSPGVMIPCWFDEHLFTLRASLVNFGNLLNGLPG